MSTGTSMHRTSSSKATWSVDVVTDETGLTSRHAGGASSTSRSARTHLGDVIDAGRPHRPIWSQEV